MKFFSSMLNKLRNTPQELPPAYGTVQAAEKPPRTSLLPPSQKKQQLAALQEGYNEMLELSRSIRDHLESQQSLQGKVSEALEQVPEAVSHLRQICRTAEHQNSAISTLVESTCKTQEMLHDAMRRSERRMVLILALFLLTIVSVIGGGFYLLAPQSAQQQPQPVVQHAELKPETPAVEAATDIEQAEAPVAEAPAPEKKRRFLFF